MNYMILSVDTGIDDALAIAYALGQKTYRLLGITVSYGMAPLEKTYRNTRHLLNLMTSKGSCLSGQQRAASGNPYL